MLVPSTNVILISYGKVGTWKWMEEEKLHKKGWKLVLIIIWNCSADVQDIFNKVKKIIVIDIWNCSADVQDILNGWIDIYQIFVHFMLANSGY